MGAADRQNDAVALRWLEAGRMRALQAKRVRLSRVVFDLTLVIVAFLGIASGPWYGLVSLVWALSSRLFIVPVESKIRMESAATVHSFERRVFGSDLVGDLPGVMPGEWVVRLSQSMLSLVKTKARLRWPGVPASACTDPEGVFRDWFPVGNADGYGGVIVMQRGSAQFALDIGRRWMQVCVLFLTVVILAGVGCAYWRNESVQVFVVTYAVAFLPLLLTVGEAIVSVKSANEMRAHVVRECDRVTVLATPEVARSVIVANMAAAYSWRSATNGSPEFLYFVLRQGADKRMKDAVEIAR